MFPTRVLIRSRHRDTAPNSQVIPRVSKLHPRPQAVCAPQPAQLSQCGLGVPRSSTICRSSPLVFTACNCPRAIVAIYSSGGRALYVPDSVPYCEHAVTNPLTCLSSLVCASASPRSRIPAPRGPYLSSLLPTCRLTESRRVHLLPQGAQSPAPGTAEAMEAEERAAQQPSQGAGPFTQHTVALRDWH